MNELKKILRAYFIIVLILFCVFGVWAGTLTAGNNTRRMIFGEQAEMAELFFKKA